MNFFKKKLPLFAIIFIVLIVYGKLPFTYFQQDEWHHFGQEIIWHEKGIVNFFLQDAISPVGIRFLPFGYLLNYIQFSLFGMNPVGYSVVSLSLHLINTLLIYVVLQKLVGNKRISFIAAALFGVWFSHQQAVTWLIQHSTTLPALTFSLMAIYFFIKSNLLGSFLSILTAILFKETAFYIFPFLLAISFTDGDNFNFKKEIFSKRLLMVLFTGLVYAALLFSFYLFAPKDKTELFIPKQGIVQSVGRRIFSVPLRVIPQSLFGETNILKLSKSIASLNLLKNRVPEKGTSQFDIYVEQGLSKKIMYFTSIVAFIVLGIILYKVWKSKKQIIIKKSIIISLAFIIFGSFPLLFISILAGNFTFLESRYLYIIDVGVVLLLAVLTNRVTERRKVFGVSFLTTIVLINSYFTFSKLSLLTKEGKIRRGIIADILRQKPDLPQKVVFYIESDKSYYGLAEDTRTLPFQSGVGELLLTKYYPSEKFSTEFFSDDFLWPIDSQGYKEFAGRGFGFYRDEIELFKILNKENLGFDSVAAFSFNSSTNLTVDNTREITGRYLGYISGKKKLSRVLKATTTFNNTEIYNVFDNNRDSIWSSKVPYSLAQEISVDMGLVKKVCFIEIDSKDNLEQNKVGYRIETSVDGANWEEVYYSKLHPPGKDGYNRLYFRPVDTRYIKIIQLGSHKFAPWVINELTIYEAK